PDQRAAQGLQAERAELPPGDVRAGGRPARRAVMAEAGGACAPCLAAGTGYAELQALIGRVYDGLLEDPPWSGLLDALRRRFAANYASLTIRLPSAEDRGMVVFAGEARPHIHALYSSSLYAVDPFVN